MQVWRAAPSTVVEAARSVLPRASADLLRDRAPHLCEAAAPLLAQRWGSAWRATPTV